MQPTHGQSLLDALITAPVKPGRIIWIGVRPDRRAPMIAAPSATLIAGTGIAGDRYRSSSNGARQVTLIAEEDLAAIASFLRLDRVTPDQLRRNIVTSGLNILALKRRRFRIGGAILEATGDCAPCSRMEETLGPGGYNAVRGRGGLTARVLTGSTIAVGDIIEPLVEEHTA